MESHTHAPQPISPDQFRTIHDKRLSPADLDGEYNLYLRRMDVMRDMAIRAAGVEVEIDMSVFSTGVDTDKMTVKPVQDSVS